MTPPSTRAGVGKSTRRHARRAGREAAQIAVDELDGAAADVALVFGTTGYDQAELLAGVRDVTGAAPLSGCSAEGVITLNASDEGSHAVSVMAIASSALRFRTFHVPGADADPAAAARALAAAVGPGPAGERRVLLLFPDGLTVDVSAVLPVLDGALGPGTTLVGATAGAILGGGGTFEYHDGAVHTGGLGALLIEGDLHPEVAVSHGGEPVGLPRTITRAEPPSTLELDGRPLLEVGADYLDGDGGEDRADGDDVSVQHLCLGVACGGAAGASPTVAGYHVVRLARPGSPAPARIHFPGGLAAGERVHILHRSPERVRDAALVAGQAIADRHPDVDPLLVLQFDCAGRGRLFDDNVREIIVDPWQRALGRHVPWLGFHSFGEIGPVGGATRYQNYSVVVCALYPGGAHASDGSVAA